MTLTWLVVLVLGIVAIICGAKNGEYKSSTFWFLTAFWAALTLAPWATLAWK